MILWTKKQARDFLVNYHYINSESASSIEEIFNRIQSIQFDPLNVVGNNSELVMQSRLKNFKKKDLFNALYKDRIIMDGWDKMMGIHLVKDYPKFKRVKEARAKEEIEVFKYRLQIEALDYVEEVLEIIREKGPIFSKDISLGESKEHRWGRTKPSAAAIDYLFHKGDIGVYTRKNTQKMYDLMERLIPNSHEPCPFKTDEEFIDYYLLRRIKTMGLVWNKNGVHFFGLHLYKKQTREKHFKRLLKAELIKEVKIEGFLETFYVPKEALDYEIKVIDNISFIAPLDNLIWDRGLMKSLFDFDYSWEVYVPAKKRKYGYYVLPILRGSDFIGRIEFDKHRNTDPLKIIDIWFEEDVKLTKALKSKLDNALKRFADYLGATDIVWPDKEERT